MCFRLHEAIKFHRPYNNEFRIQKPYDQTVWVFGMGIIERDEDDRHLFVNGTRFVLSYIKSVNEGCVAKDEGPVDALKNVVMEFGIGQPLQITSKFT